MKLKLLFASLLSFVMFSNAQATKLTVIVRDFSFTPGDATINLGDTVVFTWQQGTHTTTSTTIPAGAAIWDNPMTSTNTIFTYVPSVPGVYNYRCTPHVAMGHIGKFTVTATSDITNYELSKSVFNVYPNPAQSEINLSFNSNNDKVSSVMITDISGKTMIQQPLVKSSKWSINVNTLANGTYFVRIVQDGQAYVRKFSIAR